MRFLITIFTMFLFVSSLNANNLKFSQEMLVDKTFYIEEKNGYDTIIKFYLNENKLKMFYVIFYKNKLDETMTLDAIIQNGKITYTVFNRPTELEIDTMTDSEITVKEYHNHSKQPKNIMILQSQKPQGFAQ